MRAGLVEADDVDPGQGLDRGQLLDEHLAAAEADDADGEGDAGQQHQALGDHGHDAGHGPAEPGPDPVVRRSWLTNSSAAVGTSAQVTSLRIRSMPARSSERTRVKRWASSASWTA